jgi:hypothetical protein
MAFSSVANQDMSKGEAEAILSSVLLTQASRSRYEVDAIPLFGAVLLRTE